MPERRASRFVLEVLFLVALAVGLILANERPLVIAGVMLAGWVLAALLEWAAWRGQPHYGSGLPPRYYVPQVALPPRQPLEQVGEGYPAGRDEAPTWIASPSLRAEVLGEWPVAAPVEVEDEEDAPEFADASEPDADPWTVAELPLAPLDDEPELEEGAPPPEVRRPAPVVRSGGRTALYRFDPLGPLDAPRRRFRRTGAEPADSVEVDARPTGARPLPRAVR